MNADDQSLCERNRAIRVNPCSSVVPIVPVPRSELSIRVATLADLPFMDGLQKQFGRALGYFPTKQFEGYIEMGAVLVAVGATLVSPGTEGEASLAPTEERLGYI